MKLIDTCLMFVSCWLLMSMAIDALTPRELTVYMIAAAIAPATAVSAILYGLRVPTIDFAIIVALLWMISAMILFIITPKPLSLLFAAAAAIPMLIVGAVINFQCWRRSTPSLESAERSQTA